ncbi:hypothetical protein PC9H_011597 [Pleurotus ostreatus]|uniref:Protein kinase domain-containing protein n=1 Tax=Pleurotus ostreatus TaxID=5322 RepID=A0A8H7DQQ1_PLEOS|nr:uncharacterized protein PC9H_011597 [Pleurotus ostreatus]KAF7421077.1 hypothetical protein PC9H_011597 [Pleurotus ostreatus]KAJ8690590.1 hypothetical protein PTI98_012006 [Pleurotus ostreatus]
MNTCPSAESLHDYHYDYYNFYPSTEPYYSNSDSSMDSGLQAELFGLVSEDVDMEEYVQHVYGVSKADVEYIRNKEWKLEGLPTYTKLLDEAAPEEDLYEPFKTIMAALFDTFIDSGRKLDVHHASLGKTPLKGIWNVRKPEQLFLFGSHDHESPVAWSLAKAFVEFAVTPRTQRVAGGDSTISTTNEEGTAAAAAPASSTSDLALAASSSTKRKHCSADTPDEPKPAPKRPRLAAYAKKEPQAAGCALELLASTCRRWATGVVITDTQVTLHYYDRMGAILTQPFKFDEEPWKLALVALAIGQCNLAHAGFEPLVASNLDTALSQPLYSLQNAILKIPNDNSNRINNDSIEVVDNLGRGIYSHFQITGNPLYIYGGLTGKGSHVLPGYMVKMIGGAPSQDDGDFRDAAKELALQVNSKDTMVVKLSWPLERRPCLEARTINALVNKIPWMKRHLPKVHCALTFKGKSTGLPRHLFHDMNVAHGLEQRYFTLLFSDRYKHLWEVKTLIGFQMAFIDIVECHRTVTRYGMVLHRDISENNLLWTNDKRVVGVLNDWDLATPVDAVGNSTNHRTGTGPFMAYDLLGPKPPVHLYRHDLESLFYVLIWAVVHYKIGSDVPYSRVVNPVLKTWTGDYGEARNAKRAFLGDPEPVLHEVQPVFKPLQATWIEPLCDLFQEAQTNRDKHARTRRARVEVIGQDVLTGSQGSALMTTGDDSDDEDNANNLALPEPAVKSAPAHDIDFETLGCLTFESFMAALDHWKPRSIPKEYREYAKRLLKEDKPPVVSESLVG